MRCPSCGLDNAEKTPEYCYRCQPAFKAQHLGTAKAIAFVKQNEAVKTYYGEFTSWHPKTVKITIEEINE